MGPAIDLRTLTFSTRGCRKRNVFSLCNAVFHLPLRNERLYRALSSQGCPVEAPKVIALCQQRAKGACYEKRPHIDQADALGLFVLLQHAVEVDAFVKEALPPERDLSLCRPLQLAGIFTFHREMRIQIQLAPYGSFLFKGPKRLFETEFCNCKIHYVLGAFT